jgi:hypothetical protein
MLIPRIGLGSSILRIVLRIVPSPPTETIRSTSISSIRVSGNPSFFAVSGSTKILALDLNLSTRFRTILTDSGSPLQTKPTLTSVTPYEVQDLTMKEAV